MPLVSQTFDQLLDFTRTTAATFVGSNGLIQNTAASRNLLTQTQQFDNAAWTKTAATITADSTVAPDGTSTADTITEDTTAASTHRVTRTFATTAVAHTASVYFKAGTRSWAYIRLTDSGSGFRHAYFDLSTGTLGTVETNLTASITAVGNGWYRCVATVNIASTFSTVQFGIADADGGATYNGNGTGSIFIWGSQYEIGSTATTYTRNNGGVFPPRFDYDPVTLAPKGILIEEQRTNLQTYSEQFDNAVWFKSNATVTANTTVAPDGTSTADSFVPTATTGDHRLERFQAPLLTVGTTYTLSVYIKANGVNYFRFWWGGSGAGAQFNLITGTVIALQGTLAATIQNVGNGWFRLTNTYAAVSPDAVRFYALDASLTNSYTANGTDGLFLWGAQLEAGAFATSYIPTVASQVTRTADQCSIVAPNFAPWYNQSEGSFVVEWDTSGTSTSVLSVDDNTNTNFIRISRSNATGQLRLFTGGVQQVNIFPANVAGWSGPVKEAIAYKANDFAAVIGGGVLATLASGTVPVVFQMRLGTSGLPDPINGHIRSVRYYPVRLSNAQLQALTA